MCIGVGHGPWETYQQPHPHKRKILPAIAAITWQQLRLKSWELKLRVGSWELLPCFVIFQTRKHLSIIDPPNEYSHNTETISIFMVSSKHLLPWHGDLGQFLLSSKELALGKIREKKGIASCCTTSGYFWGSGWADKCWGKGSCGCLLSILLLSGVQLAHCPSMSLANFSLWFLEPLLWLSLPVYFNRRCEKWWADDLQPRAYVPGVFWMLFQYLQALYPLFICCLDGWSIDSLPWPLPECDSFGTCFLPWAF